MAEQEKWFQQLQDAPDDKLEGELQAFLEGLDPLAPKPPETDASSSRCPTLLHRVVSHALAGECGDGWEQLRVLSEQPRAKCRCDAVWYGDTIAYGCKTCGLSSASCICVNCFDLSEHEGHEFYISRSDYGCCDCGDPFAWRPTGFCTRHPGPNTEINPRDFIPETLLTRIRIVIRQFVRHLVNSRPGTWEGLVLEPDPDTPITPNRFPSNSILVTGLNLRVGEEQIREMIEENLMAYVEFPGRKHLPEINLVCDSDTKGSKGRALFVFDSAFSHSAAETRLKETPCVMKGSSLRFHSTPIMIEAVLNQVEYWEGYIELLLTLGKFHDGIRREIGEAFQLADDEGEVYAAKFLKLSHLMEPGVRKLETNLFVDLMLDLHFKHAFARIFTELYQVLVLSRRGAQDMSELGDFTCQIFTRTDVTLELVEKHGLVTNLLECAWQLLKPAIIEGISPEVLMLDANSNLFRSHEIVQCSMDLLYVLDHSAVATTLVQNRSLREELWHGWTQILKVTQNMNSHVRRTQRMGHVEYENQAWGSALTFHTDLVANTFLILDAVPQGGPDACLNFAQMTWKVLNDWLMAIGRAEAWGENGNIDYKVSEKLVSFHIPLNRILAALIHEVTCSNMDRSLHESLALVGLSQVDVIRWMEHCLRAVVLHSQVLMAMWRRNGESVENENEFYRMNYWHHLLLDLDYFTLRLAALALSSPPPHTTGGGDADDSNAPPTGIFFRRVMERFELLPTLRSSDAANNEWHIPKMQALVLLLVQLLTPFSSLSLQFSDNVVHSTCQVLAHGPKAHSQLWDPHLERSSASATSKDTKVLDYAKKYLASFEHSDGEHAPAKYHLKPEHWVKVDPSFPLFSWSEQQITEERLNDFLKSKGQTMFDWAISEDYKPPEPFVCYKEPFYQFARSKQVQALCWLVLARLVRKPDGRLASLGLQLALRLLRKIPYVRNTTAPPSTLLAPLSIDTLAPFMSDHFADTIDVVFETPTTELIVNSGDGMDTPLEEGTPATTTLTLRDVLETLLAEESLGPSRFLAQAIIKLARDATKSNSSSSSTSAKDCNGEKEKSCESSGSDHQTQQHASAPLTGGSSASSAALRPAPWFKKTTAEGTEVLLSPTGEKRRASQKLHQARIRQQELLLKLRKRQEQFISQNMETSLAQEEPSECVICFLDTPEEDLGHMAYLRCGPSFVAPRRQMDTSGMGNLASPGQGGKSTSSSSSATTGSNAKRFKLSPDANGGLVMLRSCGHRLHYSCWRRFRPAALERSGRGCNCPYCGQPANAWLVDFDKPNGDSQGSSTPAPKNPYSPTDFTDALHSQTRRHRDMAPHVELVRLLADNIYLTTVRNRGRRPRKESRSSLNASVSSAARNTDIKRSLISLIHYTRSILPPDAFVPFNPDGPQRSSIYSPAYSSSHPSPSSPSSAAALSPGNEDPMENDQEEEGVSSPIMGFDGDKSEGGCGDGAADSAGSAGDGKQGEGKGPPVANPSRQTNPHDRFVQLVGEVIFLEKAECLKIINPMYRLEVAILSRLKYGIPCVQLGVATWLTQVIHLLNVLYNLNSSALEEVQMLASAAGSMAVEERIAEAHDILTEDLQMPKVTDEFCNECVKEFVAMGPMPHYDHSLCLITTSNEAEEPVSTLQELNIWHMKEEEASSFVRMTTPLCITAPWGKNKKETLRILEYLPTVFPPIAASRVYQKFYTTFVKVCCEQCNKVPSIATICLNCGELLCCNSQCCRKDLSEEEYQWYENTHGTNSARTVGEVTYHSKRCGYGTCVFLQLSNSLVHVVMDGYIACWGSLYLDHYGEEDYQLARPLALSEARLTQLTQQIREVSFDFENRLKWRRVTFA